MPIARYEVADPMENHPLFKSEEQARLEETFETMPEEPLEFELASEALEASEASEASEPSNGSEAPDAPAVPATNALPWPGQGDSEGPALDEGLWGKSRDFDWGE